MTQFSTIYYYSPFKIIKFQIMQQPKILVAIRKRPLSKKQQTKGETDVVTIKNADTIIVSQYKQKVDLTKFLEETVFNFDFAFNQQTTNEQIYDSAVKPLVQSAFMGAKVTCFAYGQTGSGKTFTMNGVSSQGIPGLYTLGAQQIFSYLANPEFKHLKAKLSFFEIYCGKLFDLLNKRTQLKIRQDNKNNINIIGIQQANVQSKQQFAQLLNTGSNMRVTSQNSANSQSSRSHAILQISLKEGKKLFGKISFIDLAGNQRGADHMDMNKQTRIDGAQINKSLLSLKQCIRALDQGKGHTPFRGSKLTMVLKDSFIGFCRTVMIGNVSPSSASSQNTLNTLRYADRVKELRKPNQGISKQDLKQREMMLPRQNNKNAIRIMIDKDDDQEDIAKKRQNAQKQYGINDQIPSRKGIYSARQDQSSGRKHSLGGQKTNQIKNTLVIPKQKGQSVAKNIPNNSFSNNLSNVQKNNLANNKKGSVLDREQQKKPQYQQVAINRYNSNQHNSSGNNFGTANLYNRREPMQLENPVHIPDIIKKNNSSMSNYTYGQNGQNGSGINAQSGLNGQSGLNTQNWQANTNSNNPALLRNNQHFIVDRKDAKNKYSKEPVLQTNNYVSNSISNNGVQNSKGNYGYSNNGSFQNSHFTIPEKWSDMMVMLQNVTDYSFRQKIIEQMSMKLLNQQNSLIQSHSLTLRKQIEIIKGEMSLIGQIQKDRSCISSREYIKIMQDSIDQKISALQMIRQSMIEYSYKLDNMEQIERKIHKQNADDQQLLDDLH